MTDPTLPGIPNDAIDHAANVERARVLIHHDPALHKSHCGPHCPLCADVQATAEALTAAELRGWAKGVESACNYDPAEHGHETGLGWQSDPPPPCWAPKPATETTP